jgi:lipopolysaccharide biosynthesis glycosyltransferase
MIIPELFPEYDRCLYLDCDILVFGDIAKLYETDMGDDLMAAVPDDVVANLSFFRDYVDKFLGVPYENYFNAGILVLNLAEMRRVDIESAFMNLMNERKFPVAQDQDYLNVLCHRRITYVDSSWNQTAFPDIERLGAPNILHFKINFKPWHYDDISFGKNFWEYAEKTAFAEDLRSIRMAYTDDQRMKDAGQYEGLVALAMSETAKADENYIAPTVFSVNEMMKGCR